jgi:hypothetical protein
MGVFVISSALDYLLGRPLELSYKAVISYPDSLYVAYRFTFASVAGVIMSVWAFISNVAADMEQILEKRSQHYWGDTLLLSFGCVMFSFTFFYGGIFAVPYFFSTKSEAITLHVRSATVDRTSRFCNGCRMSFEEDRSISAKACLAAHECKGVKIGQAVVFEGRELPGLGRYLASLKRS